MEDRIKVIMAKVLGVDTSEINENTSVDTIEQWDSLRHMQLIISLENEFDIEVVGSKIEGMIHYQQIVRVIEELLDK